MSLYKAENRRLAKRWFIRWLLIGSLLALALLAGGMAVSNQKIGPSQLAAAQAQADPDYQD